ncbi:MAG: hypothetical protein Tsb0013_21230 [Phycisphaerales bacterium]
MLIELLRPATPDLARRWLAALLIVPEDEREAVVEAIEGRMHEEYDDAERARAEAARWLHISEIEEQHDGYTQRVERSYEVKPADGEVRSREAG